MPTLIRMKVKTERGKACLRAATKHISKRLCDGVPCFRYFSKRGDNQATATKTPGLRVSRKERNILEDTGRSGVYIGRLPAVNALCGKGLLRPLNQDTFELTEHGAWILKQISSGQTRRPGIY